MEESKHVSDKILLGGEAKTWEMIAKFGPSFTPPGQNLGFREDPVSNPGSSPNSVTGGKFLNLTEPRLFGGQ